MKKQTNFWKQLETKQITNKEEVEQYLCQKLGTPTNQLSFNCLTELTRKITHYYQEEHPKNFTIYSLTGSLSSPSDILEKKFKEGKRMGQTYYVLQIGKDKLQALQENLTPAKYQQIEKMAIIGKNLVFKYKKWIINKELLDFLPNESAE